ncbi:Endo/exonuclease/phosphatase domain-containing protein [Mycena venus]|uniref:Endo/exonuclease/phosphatase domain-containing protein n=1 Tax=Mycena venus TaxID=2733690 RepID=A0A8H6XZ53_9AGAR|nr:Endo/exonuclease/phosphatase domain-containing protein [Mycena venus]
MYSGADVVQQARCARVQPKVSVKSNIATDEGLGDADGTTISCWISSRKLPIAGKNGEQPWSLRCLRIAEHLLGGGTVLAGFQETLFRQVYDLAELFGEDWDLVGVVATTASRRTAVTPVPTKSRPAFASLVPSQSISLPNSAKFSVDPNSPPFVLHDLRSHTPRRAVSTNHATFTDFAAPNDTRM